ncbi:V-type ATP synthase subunit K [Calorimonas adulescens]|jgi:ATP synthase subunit C.|uniref:V-type ATP synthase subunit K n=1 Tax=Calorimonas adulescens TaxID=2606906 RepID=A0A5D8QD23_9THEO|nr:V-type ATP synthase subunit K [Calorimonas adulescens]TZE81248.1 V-type ATP synthase subunit K [Calorimonas adulescens]
MDITLGQVFGLAAAAIAIAFPGIGSAIGVGLVGESASGLISEDPDKFGQSLLLQALPGTQGIYGLLTGFIIMSKIGLLGGNMVPLTTWQGLLFLGAALPVSIVGWFSAIAQGRVAASGVGILAKRPQELAKALTYAAMVETYAVLSLLGSVLLVFGIRI